MYNLPNILTISRIVVIPVIFLSIYIRAEVWSVFAAILFIVASITDYLDGYLARARNQTSAFGRLLDPIADKLLVASALIVILAKPDMVWTQLSFIPVIVILCREILVSGLREFLREVNFQMTALSMMLLKGVWYWGGIGEVLLWIAGVLTFVTGYQYFQKSLDYIHEQDKASKKEKSHNIAEQVSDASSKNSVKVKKSVTQKKTVKKVSAKKGKSSTLKKGK